MATVNRGRVFLIGLVVALLVAGVALSQSADERRSALDRLLLNEEEVQATLGDGEWALQATTEFAREHDADFQQEFADVVTSLAIYEESGASEGSVLLLGLIERRNDEGIRAFFEDGLERELIEVETRSADSSEIENVRDTLVGEELADDAKLLVPEIGGFMLLLLVEDCASLKGNCIAWIDGDLTLDETIALGKAQLDVLLSGRAEESQ